MTRTADGASPGRFAGTIAVLLGLVAVVAAPVRGMDDSECLECHGIDAGVVEEANLLVDDAAWSSSIHAEMDFTCDSCHEGKDEYPHAEGAAQARCENCHDDVLQEFDASVHAANQKRNGDASVWPAVDPCAMCHGVHDVRAVDDPESRVYYRNVPETCIACHGDYTIVESEHLSAIPAEKYRQSVHGASLDDPDVRPAVCTDCHGYHRIALASDPQSHINPFKIPETCGTCHAEISEEYLSSVHGVAFERGVMAAPNCTNCHGIHTIKIVVHDDVSPEESRLVRSTCPACHSSEALMSEYGVTSDRVASYRASYHGLVQKRGSGAVADCASCHGVHAIYSSNDPRSSVNVANLQETCGGCHPGASEEFAKSTVHYLISLDERGASTVGPEDVTIANWVARVYWVLIIVVIGGMVAHNAIILVYHVRRKVRHERKAAGRIRFSNSQRLQHAILIITFFLLAATGFMLAYPDTWWARLFADLGITESVRRWVHRGAAIGMVAASAHHILWLFGTPYGRKELARIRPGIRDVREFLQNMRLHLGSSDLAPAFDKYDYPAKAEYWALVWGTIVMAFTGVILWFPVWITSHLPFWVLRVSEVIHLFEAWLATLAILVFHFFYVLGHPEIYPISLAMFSGRMPEEEARHRHPAWDYGGPVKDEKMSRPSPDEAEKGEHLHA